MTWGTQLHGGTQGHAAGARRTKRRSASRGAVWRPRPGIDEVSAAPPLWSPIGLRRATERGHTRAPTAHGAATTGRTASPPPEQPRGPPAAPLAGPPTPAPRPSPPLSGPPSPPSVNSLKEIIRNSRGL